MKQAKLKIGERVRVNVHSEHNGKPIVFELEGTIVSRNGRKFIRLDSGLEAPLSAAKIERVRKREADHGK